MKNKKKICVITGSRADYGLLYWTLKELEESRDIDLQIIATGMHLSNLFGLTYKDIIKDGFKINKKIDAELLSDTPLSISRSISIVIKKIAQSLNKLKPEMVILLGDRFEIFAAAISATMLRIPIAHIHGGETTEGAFDEAMRHSISKMSHLHFVATEQYKKRLIQLGENKDHIFNVGALGLEHTLRTKFLDQPELEQAININLMEKNLLVTYHPVTLEKNSSRQHFNELLKALDMLRDTNIIFTMPNADADGRVIIKMVKEYVRNNPTKSTYYTSLGHLKYLSIMKFIDGVVGNSSSGIIEAPTFKIGTVNIGDRQKGRIQAKSIINCEPVSKLIVQSIEKIYSKSFQENLQKVSNPYYQGEKSSKMILKIVASFDSNNVLKKKFYDL